LFRSAVGMDVYSYLQVLLFPEEAKASDFERILKRPNKFFSNQLIGQAKDWVSFLCLPLIPTLREWECQKLIDFILQIERFAQAARLGGGSQSHRDAAQSAADFLHMLKTDFGLAEFYREQSRLSDDLDQASDEGLLDVILALAGNYKTPLDFFQFLCKSIGDQKGNSENNAEDGVNASGREETGSNQ